MFEEGGAVGTELGACDAGVDVYVGYGVGAEVVDVGFYVLGAADEIELKGVRYGIWGTKLFGIYL